jgi:hypothetical protein
MAFAAASHSARADSLGLDFAGNYQINHLGAVPGVPGSYGGITFKDANTLLIGGAANQAGSAIYSVSVNRNASGHIVSFGSASLFATAPQIDGGLSYGPGGVLFFTGYPSNTLGQIEPGSGSPDSLTTLSTVGSVGTLAFVPSGFADAGTLKIASYNTGQLYDATLTPLANGTFGVSTTFTGVTLPGGPEGIVDVKGGNAGFLGDSMLVSEYAANRVSAYTIDGNGNPILGTRRDFITGLTGAEGATIDPISGDFLFSTFGSQNGIVAVQGFLPNAVPLPASVLGGVVLFGVTGLRREARNRARCQ